eukprot:976673-Amphidinium_carterae.1
MSGLKTYRSFDASILVSDVLFKEGIISNVVGLVYQLRLPVFGFSAPQQNMMPSRTKRSSTPKKIPQD